MAAPNFFQTGDANAVKLFETTLEVEYRDRLPLMDPKNGLIGKEPWRVIRYKDDMTKKAGDTITTPYRYQIEELQGRAGAEKLEGFEKGYETSSHALKINTIRDAVGVQGEMADQRVNWDVMDEARDALADLFAKVHNLVPHMHACGFTLPTHPYWTFHNTIEAPHADYFLRPNGRTTAESLTVADKMSLKFIEQLNLRLKLLRPRMTPPKLPGIGNKWLCWLSPEMVNDLRDENSDWFAIMIAKLKGGDKNSPLLNMALGEWGDFVFMEDSHLPPGIHSTQSKIVDKTRRGWIGGAGSLMMAHGRGRAPKPYGLNRFQFSSIEKDYGEDLRVGVKTIVGIDRFEFTKPGEASARPNGCFAFEVYADHGYTDTEVYKDWLAMPGVAMAT